MEKKRESERERERDIETHRDEKLDSMCLNSTFLSSLLLPFVNKLYNIKLTIKI